MQILGVFLTKSSLEDFYVEQKNVFKNTAQTPNKLPLTNT
jgi:hypothetical protein